MQKYHKILCGCGLFLLSVVITSVSLIPASCTRQVSATAEKLAEGFQFTEGPVWKQGTGLLFSDIPANTVYRWRANTDSAVFLRPSGNSNGLALDHSGRLLLAQHGDRRVARLESDGSQTPLATHFNGRRLNSPNDLTVKSNGTIFFTDPPYGVSPDQRELNFQGIYSITPDGVLHLLDSTLYRPNGIDLSPDESVLYVSDAPQRIIYAWDVVNDSAITNKRKFASMKPEGNADGLKTNAEGHVYATGPTGIWIFNHQGTVLDTIPVPGQTTNCNWGATGHDTLYVTSGPAVYRIVF